MLPDPLYAPIIGEKYLTVFGASSITYVDETVYDGEVYRDELDAAYVGGSNLSTSPTSGSFIMGYNYAFQSKDDRFTHTVPRYMQKTVTLVKFWDGASGTGNQVGEIPWPIYQGWSGGVPQYVGESPITTAP